MKIYTTLILALISFTSVSASAGAVSTSTAANAVGVAAIATKDQTGAIDLANPDRRRVASSAIILKTDGEIADETIPSIGTVTQNPVTNGIVDTTLPDVPKEDTSIMQ